MKDTASLMLRLPADVKGWIAEQAQQNERSQNSQIVWLLRQAMAQPELAAMRAHYARIGRGER